MKANARIALRGVINYWCGPALRAIVALYGLERRSVSSPNMVMDRLLIGPDRLLIGPTLWKNSASRNSLCFLLY